MMRLTSSLLALALAAATFASPKATLAQEGLFAPAIYVNDRAITTFELEQRIRFLELLRFPGDIAVEAEKGLIEDRLRLMAAQDAGIRISDAELQAGMAEFAGRANLETEQFLAAIAQGGIEAESFRDFVEAGLAWRSLIRTRFAQTVTVSPAEIDHELSSDRGRGAGPRVLISEIILPAKAGGFGVVRAKAEDLKETISSEGSFAEAARLNSVAASRDNGGKIDWIPLTNLPPQVRAALAQIGQGQVTEPVQLPMGIGLFQLRGLQDGGPEVPPAAVVNDYALLHLAPGVDDKAELARVRASADNCDDLYTYASRLPADQLARHKAPRGQVPGEILAALDRLDANEMTTVRRPGGGASILMLCSRNASIAADHIDPAIGYVTPPDGVPSVVEGLGFGFGPTRDQVREEILNRRLSQIAEGYLAELKAGAIIRRP